MDFKAILFSIIVVVLFIVVSSTLNILAKGDMSKLFDWSVRMLYFLTAVSFFFSLYLDLITDRSFNLVLDYFMVLINLVILLILLFYRWRLKKLESIIPNGGQKLMMVVIISIVGFPILNIVVFIKMFKDAL